MCLDVVTGGRAGAAGRVRFVSRLVSFAGSLMGSPARRLFGGIWLASGTVPVVLCYAGLAGRLLLAASQTWQSSRACCDNRHLLLVKP